MISTFTFLLNRGTPTAPQLCIFYQKVWELRNVIQGPTTADNIWNFQPFYKKRKAWACIGLILLHCRNLSQKPKKAFHSLKQCSRKFQKSQLSSAGESVLKSDGRYQRHSSSLFNFSINSLKWCTAIFLIKIQN